MTLDYDIRGELFKNKRLMNFGKIGEKEDHWKHRKYSVFGEGPTIYLDGHRHMNYFDVLRKLRTGKPTRSELTEHFVHYGQPSYPGIYMIDNGGRRSVVVTGNIASSLAKVFLDSLNATPESDIFSKRLANSQVIKIELLGLKADYKVGAYLAGFNDIMNPSVSLASNYVDYRKYDTYHKGLVEGHHYTSMAIEKLLSQNKAPQFLNKQDIKGWLNTNDIGEFESISSGKFNDIRNNLMKEFLNE